jgi:hypothetical protein
LSCIFSSWWLSWHSTPVLSIRFIVLYFKVVRNWKYKTMNLIQSTGVVCHESHQELNIQDNESYTEYWCRMSWKSSGRWLSWHSTPVLSIRFIVLYVQFLMTFMTYYTSTLYKIHCLVFSVLDDFHDILQTMNLIQSTGVECHESHQELKIQDKESYTKYWCSMSWKSSGNCLVFSVPDDFHDKLHQYSV